MSADDRVLSVDCDDFGVIPAQALAGLIVVAGACCANVQPQV
jgi:hypothetical protein